MKALVYDYDPITILTLGDTVPRIPKLSYSSDYDKTTDNPSWQLSFTGAQTCS